MERSATSGDAPPDPIGDEAAATIVEILEGASVELIYCPVEEPPPAVAVTAGHASAVGPGPDGWQLVMNVHLGGPIGHFVRDERSPLADMLQALPHGGLRAAARLRTDASRVEAPPGALRRVLRDVLVAETLAYQEATRDKPLATDLITEIIEFLIELSGTRVESHDLTHGVVVTDVEPEDPRLEFRYPTDVREVKRGPLLFDGQRAVLLVDRKGRARTELQRYRLDRIAPRAVPLSAVAAELVESGALVAETTRLLGGLGFFLRSDRSIWIFSDGRPVLIRRSERWTAFPVELATAIGETVTDDAAGLVAQAAFLLSAQRRGGILAIVHDTSVLDDVVSPKDRFDLRDEFDPLAMRAETRLHHLIDADPLDAITLTRLASLDGATILDPTGALLAYGAIVTSTGSQHEGARTVAARTLSEVAEIVLNISVDGDVTVFRGGEAVAHLLR